jgi:hypothetical protein
LTTFRISGNLERVSNFNREQYLPWDTKKKGEEKMQVATRMAVEQAVEPACSTTEPASEVNPGATVLTVNAHTLAYTLFMQRRNTNPTAGAAPQVRQKLSAVRGAQYKMPPKEPNPAPVMAMADGDPRVKRRLKRRGQTKPR